MRRVSLVCLLTTSALLISTSLHAVPAHDWSIRHGGSSVNIAYDVAVDGSGNVIIAGTFVGSMNLGGGVLTSAGSYDVFLAKFDANGVHQWSKRFGGANLDGANAVTVDDAGNITMTGYFRAPVSFGGAPLTGRAALDIFVARFDAGGVHQWSRWFGSAQSDEGKDIAADAWGNLIVTGHYAGPTDFGGGTIAGIGSLDVFVLKLDSAGNHQWSKGAGSINPDVGYGVAVDASNNVLVTGSFYGAVNFGGGAITSAGSSDVFVVKYGADGAHQWSTALGGPTADSGQGVAADAADGVLVTGILNGAFLSKYDAGGLLQWSQSFSSSDMVQGLDLAVRADGTVAITGDLRGTTNFGGGPLTSAGDDDIFLALCDATGAHLWSQRFGNTSDDWGYGCAFDPWGDLIATGIFSGSINFGGSALVSAGLSDVYLVKFDATEDVTDTTPPVITCPAGIQVEQTAPGGTPATHPAIAAFLAGASATDDMDPAPAITHDAPAMFLPGNTDVTFRATDEGGNYAECTASVSVVDSTPPRITVVLDKTRLWPPNHKLVTVCATVSVSDNTGAEPSFSLVSITTDESPRGNGAGHTVDDVRGAAYGTPDLCFDLRAERAGNGDGRVYYIVYCASDGSGNSSCDTAEVHVPHDMSNMNASTGPQTQLTSVHPNPFNPQTTMDYSLSAGGRVTITIYDARGALVRSLVDEVRPAGEHRVTWTGTDQSGRPVSSGIYFVRLAAGSHEETRKIVLLK